MPRSSAGARWSRRRGYCTVSRDAVRDDSFFRPHAEEPREARRLEAWAATRGPSFETGPIFRDASLRDAPQDEVRKSESFVALRNLLHRLRIEIEQPRRV